MKTVLIILAIIAGLALIGFIGLCRFLAALSPLFYRKAYDIPLDEEPPVQITPQTTTHESAKNDSPSLFETVVEESRNKPQN
jgi:hypothetical protein